MSVKTKAYACPHCMMDIQNPSLANLWEWICTRKHVYKKNSPFEVLDENEELAFQILESNGYIISTDIGENVISVSPNGKSQYFLLDGQILHVYCINMEKHWENVS